MGLGGSLLGGALTGQILPLPDVGGGGGGGKSPKANEGPTSLEGKPLTTAAQFVLNEKNNRYRAPVYDPTDDPSTSAFLAPYLMYNPGTIAGMDFKTDGRPQLGTYDPLGQGYYLSELENRISDINKKKKKKGMFGGIGATLGAIGGAVVGGPAGAMAGAQLGQSAGNIVFDVTSGNTQDLGADIQGATSTGNQQNITSLFGGTKPTGASTVSSGSSDVSAGIGQMLGKSTEVQATSLASPVAKQIEPVLPTESTSTSPAAVSRLPNRDLAAETLRIDNMNSNAKRLVNDVSSRYGHDSAILTSLAFQESSLKPDAHLVDKTGQAVGLMGIRAPAYADIMGLGSAYKLSDADVKLLKDPSHNIEIGAKYLSSQFERYGAETTQEALAGYYGGPPSVKKYREGRADPDVNLYVKQVWDRAMMIDQRQRQKAISSQVAEQIASTAGYRPVDSGPYGDYGGS